MEEKIFLDKGSVKVSNSRFIVNNQTYVMSNVTSVKSGVKDPERGGPAFSALVGLLMLNGSGWIFGIGVVMIILGVWGFFGATYQYSVILNTSAGETQALESADKSYIDLVISALNDAIISRG